MNSKQNDKDYGPYEGYSAQAKYEKAVSYHADGDTGEATILLQKAAEEGYSAAQFALGQRYFSGVGIGEGIKKDATKGAHWYRVAAENGQNKAMFYFGQCCEKGWGVDKNLAEAFRWYSRVIGMDASQDMVRVQQIRAKQGDADAQYWSAMDMFADGKNYTDQAAVSLFIKSADQGNADAQYELGKA